MSQGFERARKLGEEATPAPWRTNAWERADHGDNRVLVLGSDEMFRAWLTPQDPDRRLPTWLVSQAPVPDPGDLAGGSDSGIADAELMATARNAWPLFMRLWEEAQALSDAYDEIETASAKRAMDAALAELEAFFMQGADA